MRISFKSFIKPFLLFLLVVAVIAVFVGIKNSEKLKKIIPQKDPYQLSHLDEKRQENYEKLASGETSSELYIDLAGSAFSEGEIYESEYFLGKALPDDKSVIELRTKINSFKKLRTDLEKYLYEDGVFDSQFQYPKAYPLIDKILELCPVGKIHVQHLFLKGYLLLKEGRRSEARIVFENLQKNGGSLAPTSLYMYAKSFMLDDDKTNGIEPFKEYLNLYESSRLAPLAVVNLAKIYNSQCRTRDALKIIDEAIEKNPKSEYLPELMLEKETSLIIDGNSEWLDVASNTLERFPDNQFVFARADKIFEKYSNGEINSSETKLLLAVSNVLIKNGRYFQSKKLLSALIPGLKGQDLSYAHSLLALRHFRANEKDTALKEAETALKSNPDKNLKSRIYALIGEIYSAKKDVTSSEKYYLKASETNGEMSDFALREIARVAYDNGWRTKAWKYYENIVNSYPESSYASEALNYLVVMAFSNKDEKSTEKFATLLSQKGTTFEDRLKGLYYLKRIGKGDADYIKEYPLAYYSFTLGKADVEMFLSPDKSYPKVNEYKSNLAWDYFLAGCYDLAEKEYQFDDNPDDPYRKMILCYLGYYHKRFTDGIIMTRDFTNGNVQSQVEKGYMQKFYKKAFPLKYTDTIESHAPQKNFQTSFILAIIRQESFFDPKVKSSSNAIGLMQILPSTGKWIVQNSGGSEKKFESSKLTDPEYNIKNGVWYLDYLRNTVGDKPGMILAGHNGGPGNVKKWVSLFPVNETDQVLFYDLIPSRQTRNFIRNVLANQRIYEILYKLEGENIHL